MQALCALVVGVVPLSMHAPQFPASNLTAAIPHTGHPSNLWCISQGQPLSSRNHKHSHTCAPSEIKTWFNTPTHPGHLPNQNLSLCSTSYCISFSPLTRSPPAETSHAHFFSMNPQPSVFYKLPCLLHSLLH